MNIFGDILDYEEVDFDVFYNEDGEAVPLDEMEDAELRNLISNLERALKMQPEHYNAEIWEEYLKRCKKII